jgi:ATP-dependent DNA ligase
VQSPQVVAFAGISAAQALADKQDEMMDRLFPDQVDTGSNRSKTMDWILNRISDGSGLSAPRELIHFLNKTREEEMRYIELGTAESGETTLFTRQAIKNAFPEVSRVRLEQTLYAEYPDLRQYISALEREKSTQHMESLKKIWHADQRATGEIAEKLVEIGFFEKTGEKDAPIYKVPFLYRPALDLVQGSAE